MTRNPTRATWTVACAFVLLVASTLLAQQLTARPAADPAEITRMVCSMIEAQHLRQTAIDDSASERLFTQWFNDLDPQKLYFLQSDIDEFAPQKKNLDDALKEGSLEFAYSTFDRYLQRLKERVDYARTLIGAPHDFEAQEALSTDLKAQPWAKTVEEVHERWRKRIKYEALLLKLEKETDETIKTRLNKRYNTILSSLTKTEPKEVMEMYLTALCGTFDPHSAYMSPRSVEEFKVLMNLRLIGIGAVLRSEDGVTIVAEVVDGGAAAADGRLKAGDKIVGVSDEKGEILDVTDMKLTKVVEMIRGQENTIVKLKVLTKESPEPKLYELKRQVVQIKSQEVKGTIIDAAERASPLTGRIGVIQIPSFYRDFDAFERGDPDAKSTARDVKAVLRMFREKGGVDAVIVDLRDNPGGALQEAIDVSGLFIDRGPVVQVKNIRQKVTPLLDEEEGAMCKEPVVVLINRHSASASEIFAGVIKDYGRGLVVGDKTTHGKGTVQSVVDVTPKLAFGKQPDRGSMKLTIQQFYRPNGDSTQNRGVPSDIVLPSLLDVADEGESGLENALPFEHIESARYAKLGMVNADMITSLQEASRKRIQADTEFQRVQSDIQKYLNRKERKSISLNLAELQKERTKEEEALDEPPTPKSNAPVFPSGAYNNEVISIAVEYLKLLNESKTARK